MVLSRVWYVLLALLALAGISLAMVATNVIDDQARDSVRDALRRDRFELEATLKLDARARIDAIAVLAADSTVRATLREASRRGGGGDDAVRDRLRQRLGNLNSAEQLAGMVGLVIATDASGLVVAQHGLAGGNWAPGAGLGEFPLVAQALNGYLRDDVWVLSDAVYRMAARPVIDGGAIVGAIVHGKKIDDAFAQLLAARMGGASVAFFGRDGLIGGASGDGAALNEGLAPLTPAQTVASLQEARQTEAFQNGERTDAISTGLNSFAVYSPIVGSASHAQVGYAVGRPVPHLGSPFAILSAASADDWGSFLTSGAGIGTIVLCVLAGLLGLLFIWLERDRPLDRFAHATDKLAKRQVERLIPTEFGGKLRSAALHINEALERVRDAAGVSPVRRQADLDEILGPPGEAPQGPAFFGFSGDANTSSPEPQVPAPPPPGRAFAEPQRPSIAQAPAMPPPVGAPKPPAPPPGRAPHQKTMLGAGAPPPPGPPPGASPDASLGLGPLDAPRPGGIPGGPLGLPPNKGPLASTLIGIPLDPRSEGDGPVQAQARRSGSQSLEEGDEDGETMVAKVPDELIAKTANDPQAAHFREVYEQFVATKKQCGEPVAGLTFDKFSETLRKNRDQILQRHGASKVRFTVYVKEGKAALKATPIRD